MMPSSRKRTWEEKLGRSGFFVGALLLHLVIFLLIATYVIFPGRMPDPVTTIIRPPPPTKALDQTPKPPTDNDVKTPTVTTDSSLDPAKSTLSPITGSNMDFGAKNIKSIDVSAGTELPKNLGKQIHQTTTNGIPEGRRKEIYKFITKYRPPEQIEKGDPGGTFPVYVASYADGDWNCNVQLDAQGNITSGSMPNLTAKIEEWTHGNVKVKVIPKPLSIGGPDLLDTKPPFIFFTGHKDFTLTDQEVKNLQNYVEEGGLIWGDNALPGKGSRFDVAFRREMQRVIPDIGTHFEPMSMDSDIFTKQHYSMSAVPQGMSYYAEPIEHVDIDGIPAIIYTPNDYSDLYSMRILPGDKEIMGDHLPLHYPGLPLTTNGIFLHNEAIFFRNFTIQSSLAVQHLGFNIITYLITRFDDQMLLEPQ